MTCKNLCERFSVKPFFRAEVFTNGIKYCRCCSTFLKESGMYKDRSEYAKMRCVCCKNLVRHKSQIKSFKNKTLKQIKRY